MATRAPELGGVDEVQIFDAAGLVDGGVEGDNFRDYVEMATSSNCEISVLRTPAPGEMDLPADPDADRILLLLRGTCTVEGPSGARPLTERQGVLLPTGVGCRFTNQGSEPLVFFALRTESGTHRPGYVPNVPSGVLVKVPEAEVSAQGLQPHLFVYALDRETIGISSQRLDELNFASILRMNCEYERAGDDLLVNLPERLVRWLQLRDLTESDYRIVPSTERTYVRADIRPLVHREASAHSDTP
jgi:hypothetical protein